MYSTYLLSLPSPSHPIPSHLGGCKYVVVVVVVVVVVLFVCLFVCLFVFFASYETGDVGLESIYHGRHW